MPDFVRQPILNPETETKLKTELKELWLKGESGASIAQSLHFGIKGSPYEKVKANYVYFYRAKFGLPPRRKGSCSKGQSRYKHSPKELKMLTFKEFQDALDEKVPDTTFHNRRKRTFLILRYWSPLRKSEIYERTINDFEVNKASLIIHLLRKKKKYKPTVHDEPLKIPLAFPLMDEVVDWLKNPVWKADKQNRRPWRISHLTAWKYVNSVFEGYYGHFFRFQFVTQGLEDPATSVAELVAKTGLHFATIQKYIATSTRHQDSFDKRVLARINSENNVKTI